MRGRLRNHSRTKNENQRGGGGLNGSDSVSPGVSQSKLRREKAPARPPPTERCVPGRQTPLQMGGFRDNTCITTSMDEVLTVPLLKRLCKFVWICVHRVWPYGQSPSHPLSIRLHCMRTSMDEYPDPLRGVFRTPDGCTGLQILSPNRASGNCNTTAVSFENQRTSQITEDGKGCDPTHLNARFSDLTSIL